MEFSYRGWVPTVTGRLSFSHFGYGNLSGATSLTRSDPYKRYVFVYQQRQTGDSRLRGWLGERLLRLRGRMSFVCISETNDIGPDRQGELIGQVFVISDPDRWTQYVRPRLYEDFASFDSYVHDTASPSIESQYAARAKAPGDFCRDHSSFYVRFRLKRNGIIDIAVDADLRTASGSPQFPSNENERNHTRLLLAAQVFFFLRDIGHTHKHHNPKTDTIVDLHEFDASDDFGWRLATLYSIYRRIISYKRSDIIEQQISSLGLLSYAQAFKYICIEDGKIKLPAFYDDAMRNSIQASDGKIRFGRQNSIDFVATARTTGFAILGLLLSIVGLAHLDPNADIKPQQGLVTFAHYIAAYPVIAFGITFTISLMAAALERRLVRVERSAFFRGWQSLGQPFSRVLVAYSMIVVGLFSIASATAFIAHYQTIFGRIRHFVELLISQL